MIRVKDTHTRESATAKAKELRPTAFCKYAQDSQAAFRHQVILEIDGKPYMVAAQPTWVEALEEFYNWHYSDHPEAKRWWAEQQQAEAAAAADGSALTGSTAEAKPGDGHSGITNSEQP